MDPYEQTLLAEITLGDEAKKFFNSDIGRFILGRATEEIDQALSEFKDIDPTDDKGIRNLQQKIAVAEKLPIWLNECIVEGEQAMAVIDQEEE